MMCLIWTVLCFVCFFHKIWCYIHNMQHHVGLRDKGSGAEISLASLSVCWTTQCWFSAAFLNITYSTCLDCTLPVTKTFCFTFMTGFTFFMITITQKCECEFLFITLYQRLVSLYAFSWFKKWNSLFVMSFIFAVHPLLMVSIKMYV